MLKYAAARACDILTLKDQSLEFMKLIDEIPEFSQDLAKRLFEAPPESTEQSCMVQHTSLQCSHVSIRCEDAYSTGRPGVTNLPCTTCGYIVHDKEPSEDPSLRDMRTIFSISSSKVITCTCLMY